MENVEVPSITKNNKGEKLVYVINADLLMEHMYIRNSYQLIYKNFFCSKYNLHSVK